MKKHVIKKNDPEIARVWDTCSRTLGSSSPDAGAVAQVAAGDSVRGQPENCAPPPPLPHASAQAGSIALPSSTASRPSDQFSASASVTSTPPTRPESSIRMHPGAHSPPVGSENTLESFLAKGSSSVLKELETLSGDVLSPHTAHASGAKSTISAHNLAANGHATRSLPINCSTLTRDDTKVESSPRESGGQASPLSSGSKNPVSQGAHRSTMPATARPGRGDEGDGKMASPKLQAGPAGSLDAARHDKGSGESKEHEVSEESREHARGVAGQLRGHHAVAPRLETGKHFKGKLGEAHGEGKNSPPPSRNEREETQHRTHHIERDKGGSPGKDENRVASQKRPSSSKGLQRAGLGQKEIQVGIGERIKQRTKSCHAKGGHLTSDSFEGEGAGSRKPPRRIRHPSSSEDDEEDDEEDDDNGVLPLEAKIASSKGAWFDIELLARTPTSEFFHVQIRDDGSKEWVTAGEIRRQCKPFEGGNTPSVGSTVCVYTHINKNNEVEQLYFDGHVERMCSDGKYEVTLMDGPDEGQKVKAVLSNLYEISTETIPLDILRTWCTRVCNKEQSGPRKVSLSKGDFAMFEAPGLEAFRVGQLREPYTGEICDEWSEDEDGPVIRVRWLPTAPQMRKRKHGKHLIKGRATCPHEVFVSDLETKIDARTLVDVCEVKFFTSGVPPKQSEIKEWNSNHLFAAYAYDREGDHERLLPLNSDELGAKLKKVIKRCVARAGHGSANHHVVVKGDIESNDSRKEAWKGGERQLVKQSAKEGGNENDKKGLKEGGVPPETTQNSQKGQIPSKKRERSLGVSMLEAVGSWQEGEDSLARPEKNGKSSPSDISKANKSRSTHDALKSSKLSDPSSAVAMHSGPQEMASNNRKDAKVFRGSDATRDGAHETSPGGANGTRKGLCKDKHKDVQSKGMDGDGAVPAGYETPSAIQSIQLGKVKDGSKRRSPDGASGAEIKISSDFLKGEAGGEDAEAEESDSHEDSNALSAYVFKERGKKRKLASSKKIVLVDKVKEKLADVDDDFVTNPDGDKSSLVPSARVGVDTESTDGNGISDGASPASLVGCEANRVAREERGKGCIEGAFSPSCHRFGTVLNNGRPLSVVKSKWKIVSFAGFGGDQSTTVPGRDGVRVQAGQPLCIAFDLKDDRGKPVEDDERVQESFDSITFSGFSSAGRVSGHREVAWTCQLERQANQGKVGGVFFGEIRIMCRVGRYTLKASARHSDGESEEFSQESFIQVVTGPPSLHRSAIKLHLVDDQGVTLGSRARNGKHSARAANAPFFMGVTASVGQDVHAQLSVETLCDDAGNVIANSTAVMEELVNLLRVTHVYPLLWGEAQSTIALLGSGGEGRMSIEADAESIEVSAREVMAGEATSNSVRCMRLFTMGSNSAGNHVLLFRGRGPGANGDSLLFHVDLLVCRER